jgi:hypothetical protein
MDSPVDEPEIINTCSQNQGRALDELEMALLPILPVESARIAVVGDLDR